MAPFILWTHFPEATLAYRIWFDNLVISTTPIGSVDGMVFSDGFETGGTSHWSIVRPDGSTTTRVR